MNPAEELRLRRLAEIVGKDSVEEFSFYDDVDYDALVAKITVVETGAIPQTLRDVRRLTDISLSHAKQALSDQSTLHTINLADCPGPIERRRAIVTLEKMKQAIEQHGGTASIGLSSTSCDFARVDCTDRELNYVKTRIITWM
jgi:hypothetical protein